MAGGRLPTLTASAAASDYPSMHDANFRAGMAAPLAVADNNRPPPPPPEQAPGSFVYPTMEGGAPGAVGMVQPADGGDDPTTAADAAATQAARHQAIEQHVAGARERGALFTAVALKGYFEQIAPRRRDDGG